VESVDGNSTPQTEAPERENSVDYDPGVGGYLAYMAGDEDNDRPVDDAGSDHGIEVPLDLSTGARSSRATNLKKAKQDPAIYQFDGDDEDDGVLFSMPAGWNRMGIVLRDKSTMRFVKYVSRMAKGDRWDLVGEFEIVDEQDDEEKGDTDSDTVPGAREDEDSDDDGDDGEDDSDSDG